MITAGEVDQPYEMGEYGRLVVEESGPTALMERIGERIETASRLDVTPPGAIVGMALDFEGGSVGIADLGDDLIVATWPGELWERFNVSILVAD